MELVRRIFDSVNQRDFDQALDAITEDFVMDWSNSIGPAKGVYEGETRFGSSGSRTLRPSVRWSGTPRYSSRSMTPD